MIFGIDPRMVLIFGSTEVVLDHIISQPDWDDVDQIIHKAVTGDKFVIDKGVYVNFGEIKMNIYKTGDGSLAAVKAKFLEIYNLRFQNFKVKPHYDGNIVKNAANQDVLFHFTGFKPFYYNTPRLEDGLILSIMALSYFDITKSLVSA